jgi:DNA replication protein DnaC
MKTDLLLESYLKQLKPPCFAQSYQTLAQGAYITKAEPIILLGKPGVGKSHVASRLGLAACRHGRRVRFYN